MAPIWPIQRYLLLFNSDFICLEKIQSFAVPALTHCKVQPISCACSCHYSITAFPMFCFLVNHYIHLTKRKVSQAACLEAYLRNLLAKNACIYNSDYEMIQQSQCCFKSSSSKIITN